MGGNTIQLITFPTCSSCLPFTLLNYAPHHSQNVSLIRSNPPLMLHFFWKKRINVLKKDKKFNLDLPTSPWDISTQGHFSEHLSSGSCHSSCISPPLCSAAPLHSVFLFMESLSPQLPYPHDLLPFSFGFLLKYHFSRKTFPDKSKEISTPLIYIT